MKKYKLVVRLIFNGFIKRLLRESSLPAYEVNLDVKDGFFNSPTVKTDIKQVASNKAD